MATEATPDEVFKTKLDLIDTIVEYNPKWENGTGYLDHAVIGDLAPRLVAGQEAKSFSPEGRSIILIGTHFGNVVVFKRNQSPTSKIYVGNYPNEIKRFYVGSSVGTSLDSESMTLLLGIDGAGCSWNNVGAKIAELAEALDNLWPG